jgi:hypothetical protein
VWFWYENPTGSGTYQVDYEADESGSVTLTGDPIEVRATTVYVPVTEIDATAARPAARRRGRCPTDPGTGRRPPTPRPRRQPWD